LLFFSIEEVKPFKFKKIISKVRKGELIYNLFLKMIRCFSWIFSRSSSSRFNSFINDFFKKILIKGVRGKYKIEAVGLG